MLLGESDCCVFVVIMTGMNLNIQKHDVCRVKVADCDLIVLVDALFMQRRITTCIRMIYKRLLEANLQDAPYLSVP